MTITPKIRILLELPKEGVNPNFLTVSVADEEAKEIVNSFKDALWAKGDSIGDRIPIHDGRLNGSFVINPCFDINDVVALLQEAVNSSLSA